MILSINFRTIDVQNVDDTRNIIPVSYTHLDVYKRQTLTISTNTLPEQETTIIGAGYTVGDKNSIAVWAVSYTHLGKPSRHPTSARYSAYRQHARAYR